MVRIRKKTSKVLPLKKRHRIKQKVKEGERKKKKLAKKNPQWKSRVPKDPGVPNNFPFKDEIIAEAQEARNTAEEEQQRQREMQRQRALSTDEINQLSGITIIEQKPKPYAYVDPELDDSDDEEAPTLIDHDLLDLDAVLNKADVILQVLDARDPASHRVPSLEKSVAERGKKLIFILHKIGESFSYPPLGHIHLLTLYPKTWYLGKRPPLGSPISVLNTLPSPSGLRRHSSRSNTAKHRNRIQRTLWMMNSEVTHYETVSVPSPSPKAQNLSQWRLWDSPT
ncbi:hypothetical protein FRB99_003641 [Tulasnella sp. 403]|nr:hypothetical protein FRB99_003641 [Tulasnella sp. 403]